MTDKIIIAIPKYVEPGTYEYKTIVYKKRAEGFSLRPGLSSRKAAPLLLTQQLADSAAG